VIYILKVTKEYMRNSVGQIRLRNLAVLALVHKAAARMNVQEIICDFCKN
jgi:hypothetical protein